MIVLKMPFFPSLSTPSAIIRTVTFWLIHFWEKTLSKCDSTLFQLPSTVCQKLEKNKTCSHKIWHRLMGLTHCKWIDTFSHLSHHISPLHPTKHLQETFQSDVWSTSNWLTFIWNDGSPHAIWLNVGTRRRKSVSATTCSFD